MLTSPDFKELLSLFKKRDVHYLIVDGYAVMRYTEPRFTEDLDVLMSIPGVDFAEAWQSRETVMIGETEMFFISKTDLIKAKRASGRPQDLLDLENLERA